MKETRLRGSGSVWFGGFSVPPRRGRIRLALALVCGACAAGQAAGSESFLDPKSM